VRAAFVRTITELAERDPRILLLTGDLGFMAFEPFMEAFPDRFVNVGVAEQNMVGLGTGLAESGFLPFVYSIATFASLRAFEFIRNGPVLHDLPVRVVGMGGGFEYGTAGASHHSLEDIGVMRTLPGLTVIAPADHQQARTALLQTWDLPGPIYYRLGKDDQTVVPGLDGRFELGRAQVVGTGRDALIVAMGPVAGEATAAAVELAAAGVACSVMVVASISPPPIVDLGQALSRFPLALTVEAHSLAGGVGSLVAEVIAEWGLGTRLVRCGVRSGSGGLSGSTAYMHDLHGLTARQVADLIRSSLREQAHARKSSADPVLRTLAHAG
jgi:transketolase